eukprot:jgi/Pico_ML_1/55850/g1481.t1
MASNLLSSRSDLLDGRQMGHSVSFSSVRSRTSTVSSFLASIPGPSASACIPPSTRRRSGQSPVRVFLGSMKKSRILVGPTLPQGR